MIKKRNNENELKYKGCNAIFSIPDVRDRNGWQSRNRQLLLVIFPILWQQLPTTLI